MDSKRTKANRKGEGRKKEITEKKRGKVGCEEKHQEERRKMKRR